MDGSSRDQESLSRIGTDDNVSPRLSLDGAFSLLPSPFYLDPSRIRLRFVPSSLSSLHGQVKGNGAARAGTENGAHRVWQRGPRLGACEEEAEGGGAQAVQRLVDRLVAPRQACVVVVAELLEDGLRSPSSRGCGGHEGCLWM
jgi:hypothetical protein